MINAGTLHLVVNCEKAAFPSLHTANRHRLKWPKHLRRGLHSPQGEEVENRRGEGGGGGSRWRRLAQVVEGEGSRKRQAGGRQQEGGCNGAGSTRLTLLRFIHVAEDSWCSCPQCCPPTLNMWMQRSWRAARYQEARGGQDRQQSGMVASAGPRGGADRCACEEGGGRGQSRT